jgi:hypothetical protein
VGRLILRWTGTEELEAPDSLLEHLSHRTAIPIHGQLVATRGP